jgi:hypothetical protein
MRASGPGSGGPNLRRARGLLLVALLAAATGCGPTSSVSLGVKDVPTDILLTHANDVVPAPTTAPLPPGFPFVPPPVQQTPTGAYIPLPPTTLPPVPKPGSCPSASPLTGAVYSAPNTPAAAPAVRGYPVRVDGNYTITGPHATKGVYAPTDTRAVHSVASTVDGSGWTFDVTDGNGLTTSYQVQPKQVGQNTQPVDNPEQSQPGQPGIFATKFSYKRADKTTLTLSPQPALMVAKLPFAPGDKWISRSVDPTTGVAIVLNGQTGLGPTFNPSHDRLDACGTVVDAWWVQYTVNTMPVSDQTKGSEPPSQMTGDGLSLSFVGSQVAFGPQFGAIPVEETYVLKGTDGSDTVSLTRHMRYSEQPTHVGPVL